jgi:uncharacterized integral membrane protein
MERFSQFFEQLKKHLRTIPTHVKLFTTKLKTFITVKKIIALVLFVYLIIFMFKNLTTMKINFLFMTVYIPIFVEIILIGLIGYFIGTYIHNHLDQIKEWLGKLR